MRNYFLDPVSSVDVQNCVHTKETNFQLQTPADQYTLGGGHKLT